MKTRLIILLLITSGILTVEPARAVTAYPHPVRITQRDGTLLTLIQQGDERVKWARSTDGYTLVYNKSGIYEYGILNSSGDLVPSGVKAHEVAERTLPDFTFLASVHKGLAFSSSQVAVMKQVRRSLKSGGPQRAFPTTGNRKLLCILIGFSDRPFIKTQTDFQNLFNQVGYSFDGANGSVRDFYIESSYDQLRLAVDVAGPFTVSNTIAYYGANDANGVDLRSQEMVTEAVLLADPVVNFANYDNDGNGSVDGIYVIFAGYGEESGGGADLTWSHAWEIPEVICDGKTVGQYGCSPELRSSSGTDITRIGTVCHEFGHVLGAPDFYDINGATGGEFSGTGRWDLQGTGSWNGEGKTPAHTNPYNKIYLYNWATATTLNSQANLTLTDAARNANSFYRFNTSTAGEYFLMENRQKVGFDAELPGHGLMIYHVHKDIDNQTVNVTHPQMMYPVCASASEEPGVAPSSYGEINGGGCPFPGTGSKTSFTDATIPSQKSWAGGSTNKPITNITEDNTAKTISLCFMGCTDRLLNLKVLIEGAYNTVLDAMHINLGTGPGLPARQPYTVSPWNHAGTEAITSPVANVVDWVLVELRDAPTAAEALVSTKLAGWPKALLLKSDGSVVTTDGSSLPDIGSAAISHNLYVVVRHRNHLAVMSATGAVVAGNVYSFDFTTGLAQAFGGATGYKIAGTKAVMVAGDIDHDGSIFVSDYNSWAGGFGATGGYYHPDLDMDGNVFVSDYNKWASNFGSAAGNNIKSGQVRPKYVCGVPGL